MVLVGEGDRVSQLHEFDDGHSLLDRSGETCGNHFEIAGIAFSHPGDKLD